MFGDQKAMTLKKEKHNFPIEKKLTAIEWNLELLKASVEVTHTPMRTLKSMIKASVVAPTHNLLREIIETPLPQKERLAKVWHTISQST